MLLPKPAKESRMRNGGLARLALTAGLMLQLFVVSPAEGAPPRPLEWTACAGVDHPDLRCALVRVPLDHERPRGRTIEVAISRLPQQIRSGATGCC